MPPADSSRPKRWDEWLKELKVFKRAHGHCKVPYSQKPLYSWLYAQHYSFLNPESAQCLKNVPERKRRTKELEAVLGTKLGDWTPRQQNLTPRKRLSKQEPWDERLEELKTFKKAHGHCMVPHSQKPLYPWLYAQHYSFLNPESAQCLKNVPERKRRTKEIEAVLGTKLGHWKIEYRYQWDQHLNELKEFKRSNGHCLVPDSIQPLHGWLESQCVHLLNAVPPMRIEKSEWDSRRKALESVLGTGLDNWKLAHADLKRQVDLKQSHSESKNERSAGDPPKRRRAKKRKLAYTWV